MTTETTPTREQLADAAKAIYRETIRPQLTENDKGSYVFINVRTEQWIANKDEDMARNQSRQLWGDDRKNVVILKAGYRTAVSFRPGLNQELAEW